MLLRIATLGLGLLLAACTTAPATIDSGGAEPVRPGMRMTLTRPVTIPGGDASVYIQNGKVVQAGTQDVYYAWCRLIFRSFSPVRRTLPPTDFEITAIRHDIEDAGLPPLRYASLDLRLAGGATADDYITIFLLKSTQEPAVDRLECAHWEDPTLSPAHLTAREIRKTLGDLLVIR